MTVQERLARNLRVLRAEKGWSQEDLGFAADVHRTYISDLERAASRNPSIQVLERLANCLGVPPARLLD